MGVCIWLPTEAFHQAPITKLGQRKYGGDYNEIVRPVIIQHSLKLANTPAPSISCEYRSARVHAGSDCQAVGRYDGRYFLVFCKVEGETTCCGEPAE